MRWFGLRTLYVSAKEDSAATQFARFADARQAQAGVSPAYAYDLSNAAEPETFIMDYVADTGDGYDATFAVARSIDGSIPADDDKVDGSQAPLDRAHLVVLGGDEVYPVASVKEYDNRLRRPFEDAVRPSEGGKGFLVALPGNHDWYDGLNAFRRYFCESFLRQIDQSGPPTEFMQSPSKTPAEGFLDRTLFQTRSYFAVKLPHGWWLWGVDCQLDSHIDTAQLAYFEQARELIEAHERVIICFPRPAWTDHPKLDEGYYLSNRETMTWFVERMFPTTGAPGVAQVSLVLSGDKHHYTRYAIDGVQPDKPTGLTDSTANRNDAPRQLVTCGGGGAYLSSTHHAEPTIDVPWHPPDKSTTRYSLQKTYPSIKQSRCLRWRLYRIPFVNGLMFPVLLAAVDSLLLVWLACVWNGWNGWHDTANVGVAVWYAVVGLALGGFSMGFRPKHRSPYAGLALGAIHAACHGGLVVLIYAYAWPDHDWTLLPGIGLSTLVAWVIFPVFLFLCDSDWIHWHENEFFSGMKFESYKSHLRITIQPIDPAKGGKTGRVTVTVHVIKHPPKNRKHGTGTSPIVEILETFDVDELT